MESIKTQGLLQPITVRPVGDCFEIVFGLHRFDACRRLDYKEIHCQVRELDDSEAFLMAEAENLQRNDFIDPIAEAIGFSGLVQAGLVQEKIASKIGKKQQYVSSRLALLKLEPEIRELITSRLVNPEHAYELTKVDDQKKRRTLAELCRKDKEDPLTLMEVRVMAKQSWDELSKDPRVDAILLRDPMMGRVKRIEAWLAGLNQTARDIIQSEFIQSIGDWMWEEDSQIMSNKMRIDRLTTHGSWKRDNCTHYNGDICQEWSSNDKNQGWLMKKQDEKWKVRVSKHPEYCATCPTFNRKRLAE